MTQKVHRGKCKLLEKKPLTKDVSEFIFSIPQEFNFYPGQFITFIIKDENDKKKRRSYSIASAPSQKGELDLCIKRVEGGFGSNKIFDMKIGEELDFIGPAGVFFLKTPEKDITLISSGTGIAPFISMIRELFSKNYEKKLTLIAGFRYEDEILYKEELESYEKKHSNFKFVPVISRPKTEVENKGHVQDVFEKYLDENFTGDFYLCGLWNMVRESMTKLQEMKYQEQQINYERYD
jgi:NAD(P)H-flavin reductase